MGDSQPNVASVSVAPNGPAAVGFVGDEPVGVRPGPTGTGAVESHRAHQGQEHGHIVLMACGQRQDQWLAHAIKLMAFNEDFYISTGVFPISFRDICKILVNHLIFLFCLKLQDYFHHQIC